MDLLIMKERLRCHEIVIKVMEEESDKRTTSRSYPIGEDPYMNGEYYEKIIGTIADKIMNPEPEKAVECEWVKKWPIEVYKSCKSKEIFVDPDNEENILLAVSHRTYAFYCVYSMDIVDDNTLDSITIKYSLENLQEYLENLDKVAFLHQLGYSTNKILEKNTGESSVPIDIEFKDDKPVFESVPDKDIQIALKDNRVIMLDRNPWDLEIDSDFFRKEMQFHYYRRLAFARIPKNYELEITE